ncbi:hypothetical protein [Streptomyces sp. NBC_01483]|uniref:hypothetical protein n=1 Tax=Streptomyces sp. NBC_01483 TaxID=2903883 RepID=UPI002E333058|nr:hypothetical protein [Streptomyces sp. NBC_01483]
MTVLFGDFEDFSHLDLHLLAAADAHERAQIRLDRVRISARAQGMLPDYHRDDIAAARSGSWRLLRRDELGDEQPERLGGRLYLLAFEGLVRYIKVGMVEGRTLAALRDRVRRHEHAAEIHHCFLFDAWASQPCTTDQAAKQWEDRVLGRLNTLVNGDQVWRVHQEYFYGIPFDMAMTAIEVERPEVDGAPRHPGVVYQE